MSKFGWEEVYLVVEIMSQNKMCKGCWKITHGECISNCELPEHSRQVGNMLLSVNINIQELKKGRKVVHGLIKPTTKSEVSERRGEVVHRHIET